MKLGRELDLQVAKVLEYTRNQNYWQKDGTAIPFRS